MPAANRPRDSDVTQPHVIRDQCEISAPRLTMGDFFGVGWRNEATETPFFATVW